jgi:hypothetical protein
MPARVTTTNADSNDPGELTQQPLGATNVTDARHDERGG